MSKQRKVTLFVVGMVIGAAACVVLTSEAAGACPWPQGDPRYSDNWMCELTTTTTEPETTTTTVPETTTTVPEATTTVPDQSTTTTPGIPTTTAPPLQELPRTGSGTSWLAMVAGVLVLGGLGLTRLARRVH